MANSEFVDLSDSAIKLGEFLGHEDEIRAIEFSNDCNYVYSGGWDNQILRWELPPTLNNESREYLEQAVTFKGHSKSITALKISPDGRYLFSSSKDGTVKIWDLDTRHQIFSLDHGNKKVFALNLNKNSNYLVSGGEDTNLRIWNLIRNNNNDLINYECIKILKEPSAPVHVAIINKQDRFLACSGDEPFIYLWNFPSGEYFGTLEGHKKDVYSIDFHPKEKLLASGGKEKKLILWDYGNCEITNEIAVPASVSYLTFNQTGEYLLTADFKNNIRIYDIESCEMLQDIRFKKGEKLTIGLSKNWKFFALVPFAIHPSKIYLWTF